MAGLTLSAISEKLRDIDFAVLSTRTENGSIAGRPMSNNGQVSSEGDNYFFTLEETGTVQDIRSDPNVGVSYRSRSGPFGMKPFFLTIEGKAELIREKPQFARHWTKDLDAWFKDGIDTPGLVLVKIRAERLHYWDGFDEAELSLQESESRDPSPPPLTV